jgi:hypothetical protein
MLSSNREVATMGAGVLNLSAEVTLPLTAELYDGSDIVSEVFATAIPVENRRRTYVSLDHLVDSRAESINRYTDEYEMLPKRCPVRNARDDPVLGKFEKLKRSAAEVTKTLPMLPEANPGHALLSAPSPSSV